MTWPSDLVSSGGGETVKYYYRHQRRRAVIISNRWLDHGMGQKPSLSDEFHFHV